MNITFLVALQLSEGLIKLAAGRAEPSLDFYLFSWASPATWSLETPKVLACHAAEIVFGGNLELKEGKEGALCPDHSPEQTPRSWAVPWNYSWFPIVEVQARMNA